MQQCYSRYLSMAWKMLGYSSLDSYEIGYSMF
jgi:hypothetical protein